MTEPSLADVERYARRLGVWPSWADDGGRLQRDELRRRSLAINPIDDTEPCQVRVWLPDAGRFDRHADVDIPTALLILAGHAFGVELDVGLCPECGGKRSFWWDGEDCHPPGMVQCYGCQRDAEPEVYEMHVDGISKARSWAKYKREQGWTVEVEREPDSHRYRLTCSRPTREPTGRDVRPWAQAVLDAMPRKCTFQLLTPELCDPGCPNCGGTNRQPGDPTARAALTDWSGADDLDRYETLGWADTVDDTLAVWHDDHLARGGEPWQVPDGDSLRWTPAAPRGLAEHSDVARAVAVWLSGGRCPAPCFPDPDGEHILRSNADGPMDPDTPIAEGGMIGTCPQCNGHGTAAGAKVPLLLEVLERVAPH